MASTARSLSVGEQVGEFKILAMAGAGAMGVVYVARDLKLERTVALKFLPFDLNANPEEKGRLLEEARAASVLDHPNIGVVHSLEETSGGQAFIVMAYYEGLTLTEEIRRRPLQEPAALGLLEQIASGLAEAHRHSIIHRDIKPSNIIITKQGVAKIVDFGIARAVSATSRTITTGAAGTLAYMSPDQIRGEALDTRTDIWSLGVVFAEMLTGRSPFHRESMAEMLRAITEEPPAGLDAISPPLQRIIYRAVAKDRDKRYQSCDDLLADVRKFHLKGDAGTASRSLEDLKRDAQFIALSKRAKGGLLQGPWWQAAVLVLLLAAAVASFVPAVHDAVSRWFSSSAAQQRIAVLPFDSAGGDPSAQDVAAGLMDSLTGKLSNFQSGQQALSVVPASEVRRRKVTDPVSAQQQFGATMVVMGSVQHDAKIVRLTLNLIDTRSMRQIGSIPLQDAEGNFATLQDEAVDRLAELMHVTSSAESRRPRDAAPAAAAYESYLKALGYMERYDRPGNLDLAISALEGALRSDPQFALGYAQLGEAYRLKHQGDPDAKWVEYALANCRKAVELNDRLPSAYVALGRIHNASGNHDLALQEFQRALELDSRNADAYTGMGHAYEAAGRMADAEAAFQKAAALRPEYWDGYNTLALFYDGQGRYDLAIANLRHALELTPDNAQVYFNLGAVLIDTGDPANFSQAEQALKKSVAIGPIYAAYANLGYLYVLQKRYRESVDATLKALELNNNNFITWGNLALAYARLGDAAETAKARTTELMLAEKAAQSSPRDAQVQAYLAGAYARAQRRDLALAKMQTALALSPDDSVVLENVGETYEKLGDRERAVEYISKSIAKGYSLSMLRGNPELQGLMSDPRFRDTRK